MNNENAGCVSWWCLGFLWISGWFLVVNITQECKLKLMGRYVCASLSKQNMVELNYFCAYCSAFVVIKGWEELSYEYDCIIYQIWPLAYMPAVSLNQSWTITMNFDGVNVIIQRRMPWFCYKRVGNALN